MLSHWPASYDNEWWRSTKAAGNKVFGSVPISVEEHDQLAKTILTNLAALEGEWGRDAFFLHEWRDLKGSTNHDPACREDIRVGTYSLWDGLDRHAIQEDESHWFVDVGLEFNYATPSNNGDIYEDVLLWRRYSAWRLIHLILGCTEAQAHKLFDGRNCSQDEVAHLQNVAGFRLEVPSRYKGPRNVVYINCYTTDKSHIYSLDKGKYAKAASGMDWLKAVLKDEDYTYPKALSSVYSTILQKQVPVAARIEIRVPIAEAHEVFMGIPNEVLESTVLRFSSLCFW
jgi:hypothetical protein